MICANGSPALTIGYVTIWPAFVFGSSPAGSETCQWLRAQSLGDRLIVLDQINGYCIYMVTREQYLQGGYSYWCSCLARDAEPLMKRQALELIRVVV